MNPTARRLTPRWTLGLAAVGLVAAACGGSSSGSSGSPQQQVAASQSGATATQVSLVTHSGPKGTYLTDSSGRSLYMFAADKNGKSACNGGCVKFWPPLTGSAATTSGAAVAAKAGTITRSDGTTQITYNGHPLYRYSGDSSAGATNGEGLNLDGGLWWLVSPAGAAITANSAPASSAPASTGSGWS